MKKLFLGVGASVLVSLSTLVAQADGPMPLTGHPLASVNSISDARLQLAQGYSPRVRRCHAQYNNCARGCRVGGRQQIRCLNVCYRQQSSCLGPPPPRRPSGSGRAIRR